MAVINSKALFSSLMAVLAVISFSGAAIAADAPAPSPTSVKLDSQDLLQIGDKKFYFLLPTRSIFASAVPTRSNLHYVPPPPPSYVSMGPTHHSINPYARPKGMLRMHENEEDEEKEEEEEERNYVGGIAGAGGIKGILGWRGFWEGVRWRW